MKCVIAKDLLPLYAEGLCSEETGEELEKHLKECKACRESLEVYKSCPGEEEFAEANKPENRKDLAGENREKAKDKQIVDSMKKVKKKLSFRKKAAILLSALLLVVLVCAGVLYVGECTGKSMNFTTIHNISTLKKVSKALCKGDVEPLVEQTYMDFVRYFDTAGGDGYYHENAFKEQQRRHIKEAIDYYFKGEEFHYRLIGVEFVYDNELPTGVSEYFGGDLLNPAAVITMEYYNDQNSIEVTFYQKSDKKFLYEDNISNYYEGVPAIDCRYATEDIFYVIKKVVEKRKEQGRSAGGALSLLIRYDRKSLEQLGEKEERTLIAKRIDNLQEKGFFITDMLYSVQGYADQANAMVYKFQFHVEDEMGNRLIMEQIFHEADANLYIVDGNPAEVIGEKGEIPQEIRQEILGIFAPVN